MELKRRFRHLVLQVFAPGKLLHYKYQTFKELLAHDQKSLELLTELEEIWHTGLAVDWARVASLSQSLCYSIRCLIDSVMEMNPRVYEALENRFQQVAASIREIISLPPAASDPPYIIDLAAATSTAELAGGKAQSLSRIIQHTKLPVPRGFVVTTHAFQLFLDHNQLRPRLDELLAQIRLDDTGRLEELSQALASLIKQAEIPPVVAAAISQKLQESEAESLTGPWVVRSSAYGEDGERTWAGQYTSVLNVLSTEVLEAYKAVIAGKYTPRALAYRIRSGLADQEVPMAALFLEMVEAAVSGVIYTAEPRPSNAETCLAVYAIPDRCERLVDGSTVPEVHYLSREPQSRLVESLASPFCRLDTREEVGTCLSPETAILLARWGMELEKLAGRPQDIEWVQDKTGNLFILQSRALASPPASSPALNQGEAVALDHLLLLAEGVTASPGVGIGQVFIVRQVEELRRVPEAAILVGSTLPPAFASIIDRLRAVVADGGSRASHFASVAREYGLPVIVETLKATECLSPGQIVTVDANHCRVYQGEVESLKTHPAKSSPAAETRFMVRLRQLMEFISPLRLTDPEAADFVPQSCRSMHDFVRFCHEKGMSEMFSLIGRRGRGLSQARRLDTELPLVMYVLDLEDGIAPQASHNKSVEPRFITCKPMQAFWEGLSHPDVVWQQGLIHLDWEEFDRVSGGLISLRSAALASYALVSKDYLHLNLRFGYHFAVTDTLCGYNPEANYIAFRFKGGGGNYANRLLRVQFIQSILEWAGFAVKTQGDLLDARFERHAARPMLSRLTLLGLLQGKTRLLDMALTSTDQVIAWTKDFKERYAQYILPNN
ncbi:MAG: PEP/pyruvate-binding domain-containing protein [Desulfobacca sp.]|nr:PEP/pyruvate-binding domain-containing protein [Desulfobacca sp.]